MNQDNNFNQQSMFDNQYQQSNQNVNNVHYQNPNTGYDNVSYTNANNNQNKFKIIGLIAVVVAIIFAVVLLFGGSKSNSSNGGTKNGTTVNQGQKLKIKSDFVNIDLKVEDIERNVKLLDLFGEEDTFTKIKLSIVNNEKENDFNGTFIAYELLDGNKNTIEDVICYTEIFMGLYDVDDAIVEEISANSTSSGYLYCKDDKNLGKMLAITSFTEFDEELIQQGHIKSTDKDVFYVNLK